jgi:ABC-2 type transport system permease protein
LLSRRSPFAWLLQKEVRELAASKSWWILLVAIGPLVGISFASAVRTYAEVSGLNGTAAGVGEALSPLIGVWGPTFSACELAAVFLLPFVVIRLVAGDRQSGAFKLEHQRGMSPLARISAKSLVLLGGWMVAMIAPLSTVLLWRSYGGTVFLPELGTLTLGHLLNAGLTIALAAAMAALAEHPSTAAILTLSFTVGTWIVNFFAAVEGGWWERAAGYTPAAMVAEFQHGLLRLETLLVTLVLIVAGLGIAALWIQLGRPLRYRAYEAAGVILAAAALAFACSHAFASWDTSEARANSFPEADQQALRRLPSPLRIEVHLAPEDPRRSDLESRALSKLRRLLPRLDVQYISSTSIGIFEQTRAGYGEIWYEMGDRRIMSRVTTAEGVLESIYAVAGIAPPAENDEATFRGHPLAVPPRGANVLYCGIWPAVVLAGAFLVRKAFR